MRHLLLNFFIICSITLAISGQLYEVDDVNDSVHISSQNGNVVTVSQRRMNGQDKKTIDVSALNIRIDGDNCELNF